MDLPIAPQVQRPRTTLFMPVLNEIEGLKATLLSEPPRIGGDRKLQVFRWGAVVLLQAFRELYHWR